MCEVLGIMHNQYSVFAVFIILWDLVCAYILVDDFTINSFSGCCPIFFPPKGNAVPVIIRKACYPR